MIQRTPSNPPVPDSHQPNPRETHLCLVQNAVQVAAVAGARPVDARDDVTQHQPPVVVAAGPSDPGAPRRAALAGIQDKDAWEGRGRGRREQRICG